MDWADQARVTIAEGETRLAYMLAVNRITGARKLSREQKALRLCRDLGLKLADADALLVPDDGGRIGFSAFSLAQKRRHITRLRRSLGPGTK